MDKLLARKANQKALMQALEADLRADPVRFFKSVIMPLLPRESRLAFDHDGVIEWRSLLVSEPVSSEQLAVGSGQDAIGGERNRG